MQKTMYMEFKNAGTIPLNAFKLLGASTKRGDTSKIGFFGTGLKYAIAMMMRDNISFKIYVGKRKVVFDLVDEKFAGQTMKVLTVNGEKTSLTTDAAIDWEPWFAIREIYSNAIDEGGSMELVDTVTPESGMTKIYVEMGENLGNVASNWQDYFSMKRESLSDANGARVLQKRQSNTNWTVFRKGIRVYISPQKSFFDYDVPKIDINESRVAKQPWEPYQRSAEALAGLSDVEALGKFINNWLEGDTIEYDDQFWTYGFDFSSTNSRFSEAWKEVLKDKRVVPRDMSGFFGVTNDTVCLPAKLIKLLYNQFKDELNLIGYNQEKFLVTGDYDKRLDGAFDRLNDGGFTYPKDQIKTAKFQDNNIMGMFDNLGKRILISDQIVVSSTESQVTVLLEEMLHAHSGFSDRTTAFQDYIIGKLAEKIAQ